MAEHLWFTTARLTIHLARRDNRDGISLIEHHMPPHIHEDETESFYMLGGQVSLSIGDGAHILNAGDAISVAAGQVHSFRVLSDEARFLTMTTGPFEDMVRSLARPAAGPGLPPQDEPTPAQIDGLIRACAAHGIAFVGPPA